MDLSQIQVDVLNILLDRFEKRSDYSSAQKSPRRTLLKVDFGRFPDYHHPSDAAFRLTFNAEMQQLETGGLVKLDWQRFSEGEYLQRIALNDRAVREIYRLLGRRSKEELYRSAADIFEQWSKSAPPELRCFYLSMLTRLKNLEPLPAPFKPGREGELKDLLAGLNAVFEPRQGELARRLLSVRLYGDSKRWQSLERHIVNIIKEYCPAEIDKDGEANEVLAERGIVDNPGQISLAGPLVFSTAAGRVDLKLFYPDLGLSTEMAADLTIDACPAAAVVTVENKTSYYQYIKSAPSSHLVIYLGGYHNPPRRKLLEKLSRYFKGQNRQVPFYHWGDLDYGGITIWQRLTEKTGIYFEPLYMDKETYLKHLSYGQRMDERYCSKLAALLDNPDLQIFYPLIALMLKHKLRVEQEAVEPDL